MEAGCRRSPIRSTCRYSLVQALTLVVNPWLAVLVTTAIAALAGYVASYRLAKTTLGLTSLAATLCAIFYVGNGFFIEHMIVGHLGFQLFPMGAVMLSVMIDPRRRVAANGALLALVAAAMLHQAGFYLLILEGLSMALTLPVLAWHRATLVNWRRVLGTIGVALVLSIGMTASKIYAALSLMRQFPREAADVYPVSVLQALAGFVSQLTGAMVLAPVFALLRIEPSRVSGALMKVTGADVRSGVWEVDTGLSPVLIAVLVVGLSGWRSTSALMAGPGRNPAGGVRCCWSPWLPGLRLRPRSRAAWSTRSSSSCRY